MSNNRARDSLILHAQRFLCFSLRNAVPKSVTQNTHGWRTETARYLKRTQTERKNKANKERIEREGKK